MLTNDPNGYNPQDVFFRYPNRLGWLIKAMIDTNNYIEESRRDKGLHWANFDAGQISSYRRIVLIPSLLDTFMSRDGIEDHKVDNLQFWLLDGKVAFYVRLGDETGLRSDAPRLLSKPNRIVVAGTPPRTIPMFPELEVEADPDFDKIREDLRICDLVFIVGLVNPTIDGLIGNFYIGTHVGKTVDHIREVELKIATITPIDREDYSIPKNQEDEDDDESRTNFGDDDDGVDDENTSKIL